MTNYGNRFHPNIPDREVLTTLAGLRRLRQSVHDILSSNRTFNVARAVTSHLEDSLRIVRGPSTDRGLLLWFGNLPDMVITPFGAIPFAGAPYHRSRDFQAPILDQLRSQGWQLEPLRTLAGTYYSVRAHNRFLLPQSPNLGAASYISPDAAQLALDHAFMTMVATGAR